MQMFNVLTIIMQSVNVKEWKLLELQIYRHPLSIFKENKVQDPKIWKKTYEIRKK